MFPTGALSFQALQQMKSSDDIKLFLCKRKGKKYSMKKNPDNPPKDFKSPEAIINGIKETITTNEINTDSKESICELTNENIWWIYLSIMLTSQHPHQID